jgi:hypothetical protein
MQYLDKTVLHFPLSLDFSFPMSTTEVPRYSNPFDDPPSPPAKTPAPSPAPLSKSPVLSPLTHGTSVFHKVLRWCGAAGGVLLTGSVVAPLLHLSPEPLVALGQLSDAVLVIALGAGVLWAEVKGWRVGSKRGRIVRLLGYFWLGSWLMGGQHKANVSLHSKRVEKMLFSV